MAIKRVIKDRYRQAFLARNSDEEDGLFTIYMGSVYRLYDEQGELWMKIAVRRQLYRGIVLTDMASGLMVISGTGAKTYNDAVLDVSRQYESINKAMVMDYYKKAVKLCQEEYDELREWGALK